MDVDGRVTVYAPGSEHVLFLNETASDVWRLLDGEHAFKEIVDLLASAYGVDASEIASEVRATLSSFVAAGLVVLDVDELT